MIRVTTYDEATPMLQDLIKKMPQVFKSGMWDAALHLEGEIKEEILRKFSGGKGTTGGLMNSYHAQFVKEVANRITTGAFSDLIYAAIQNIGGTILPKTVKNLAIPISDRAKTTVGKWPRHYPKGQLTFIKSKRGNALLVEMTKGKNRKIKEVMFALKKKVVITGKHYLESAAENAVDGIEKLVGDKVEIAVTEA